jgi:hypothetical protein
MIRRRRFLKTPLAFLVVMLASSVARADTIFTTPDVTITAGHQYTVDVGVNGQFTFGLDYYGDARQPYVFSNNAAAVLQTSGYLVRLSSGQTVPAPFSAGFASAAAFFQHVNNDPNSAWSSGGEGYVGIETSYAPGHAAVGWLLFNYNPTAQTLTLEKTAYQTTSGPLVISSEAAVPEIDPGSAASAMALLGCGVVMWNGRRNRKRTT